MVSQYLAREVIHYTNCISSDGNYIEKMMQKSLFCRLGRKKTGKTKNNAFFLEGEKITEGNFAEHMQKYKAETQTPRSRLICALTDEKNYLVDFIKSNLW